jgi:hypothetical protein
MNKFYRVKKDTFLWKEGAILKNMVPVTKGENGYRPIEDIWDTVDHGDYISHHIIEHPNNSEFFERVYPDTIIGNLYRTKDQLVNKYKELFADSDKV